MPNIACQGLAAIQPASVCQLATRPGEHALGAREQKLGGEGEAQPVNLRERREDPPREQRARGRQHRHARQAHAPAVAPHQHGERHRHIDQRGARIGEHQRREEHRAARRQRFARHRRFFRAGA